MMSDEAFMHRCFDLAQQGSGNVAPNPLVGCVIVSGNKIAGEGFHRQFGKPHAEANAIEDLMKNGCENLLHSSTLYVNLEPCSHYGKTPPCADLIISSGIKKIFVAVKDPFPAVNGSGIEKLRNARVEVITGVLEEEAKFLNRRFFTFHLKKRPYVILKFAQTSDGFMATAAGRLKISNGLSDRLVHQWRSEEQSIMIGTRTAETDNPFLTVRHHAGKNPLRIVIDKNLRLSPSLNIFNGEAPTIIMNNLKNEIRGSNEFLKISFDDLPAESLKALHERSVQSLLIEGGKNLLEQFIEADLWDEIRVITSPGKISDGLKAPDIIPDAAETLHLDGDKISVYYNNSIKASP